MNHSTTSPARSSAPRWPAIAVGVLLLLFGAAFWKRLIDFDLLIETGMISPDDVHLFKFVETAEEGWAALEGAYGFEGIEVGDNTP